MVVTQAMDQALENIQVRREIQVVGDDAGFFPAGKPGRLPPV